MKIDKALDNIGKLLISRAKAMSKADKTHARGVFTESFKFNKDSDLSLVFYNDSPYAKFVVDGSNPAKKKLSKAGQQAKQGRLIDWIRAKGIQPRNLKTGKFMSYKDFAKLLSVSIAKKGTIKRYDYKGSDLINRLFKEVEGEITKELEKAFLEKINNEIKVVFDNGSNTQ